MPSNMHLILISRADSRLRLARLDLNDELVIIGRDDLCFDVDEISQFFRARGYHLHNEDVRRIESHTEGWAAALVAITLSLGNHTGRQSIARSFASSDQVIENYLAEDVFTQWTRGQQAFIEKTIFLDKLCGPLCEAVVGCNGDQLLMELYESNGFLIPLDGENFWFRYHHLFAELFRRRLKSGNASFIQDLYRKSGRWMQENGFHNEAIECYLKAEDYDEALPLIEQQTHSFARRRECSRIVAWSNKLPLEYTKNSPRLMMTRAVHAMETNDLQSASKFLEQIEAAAREGSVLSNRNLTSLLLTKANLFLIQGDFKKCFQSLIAAAARDPDTFSTRKYLDLNLYDVSLYRCTYHNLFKILRKNSGTFNKLVVSYQSLINEKPGFTSLFEGEFCYETGLLDEALPKLLQAVEEATNADCPGALVPAMVTIAKIQRARGNRTGALTSVDDCLRRTEKYQKPHWAYLLNAFKVRLQMDTGDVTEANKWMEESRLGLYHEITPVREYEMIVLARCFISSQRYDEAAILLNRILVFAEEKKRNHTLVEVLNLLSITADRSNNEQQAAIHFGKSLSIGLKEGYVRSFVDELAPMVSLLEMYLGRHHEKDKLTNYAKKLLLLTEEAIKHSRLPLNRDTVEKSLTPAEKKVLRLMVNAYTNNEIAQELGLALITVKVYTSSIYKKLGVKNRAQCIKLIKNV
ncbi:MAG: LuxR C-terminal-related transcriptional regulator [Desulfitobacteriaceae bacterium]|nr:LuxR C-terminal-related transcriptional regulator [Desulfitobacteriaceae bacterium]